MSELDQLTQDLIINNSEPQLSFWDFDFGSDHSKVSVVKAVDEAFKSGLAALNEGGQDGPRSQRSPLPSEKPSEKQRRDVESQVQKWLEDLLAKWVSQLDEQNLVIFFEYLRQRCYDLYDRTLDYSTVTCFVRAASKQIDVCVDKATAARGDGGDVPLLESIAQLLKTLLDDVAVFQGVNQADTPIVVEATAGAIKTVGAPQSQLQGYSDLGQGWREELRRRLETEAEVLYEVYDGIHEAACVLKQYEAFIGELRDKLHDSPKGEGEWEPALQRGLAGDGDRSLLNLRDQIEGAHHSLHERVKGLQKRDLKQDLDSTCRIYASRLPPWREVLAALGEALKKEHFLLLPPRVQLRYCFPFAIKLEDGQLQSLPETLRPRTYGLTDAESSQSQTNSEELYKRLRESLKDLVPQEEKREVDLLLEVQPQPIPLTNFWQDAGAGIYGGDRVKLPDVVDVVDDPLNRWQVWIDLSRLENHCLYIERALTAPTPTELYRALRVPAYYLRSQKCRYQLIGPDSAGSPESARWHSINEFADAVIRLTAAAFGNDNKEAPDYEKGECHVVAVLTTPTPLGNQPKAIASALACRHGGRLFQVDVNRLASTLAEWLRYPPMSISSVELGFCDDWVARLNGITVFGVAGNPSWQTDTYMETVSFAASCGPLMALWERRIVGALDSVTKALEDKLLEDKLKELRKVEEKVRRHIAFVHSEKLCTSHLYRDFLNELMTSTGVTSREQQLEQQLSSVKLLIAELESKARQQMDYKRNKLLAYLAVFGAFSIGGLFAALEHVNHPGPGLHKRWTDGPFLGIGELVFMIIFAAIILLLIRHILRSPSDSRTSGSSRKMTRGSDSGSLEGKYDRERD